MIIHTTGLAGLVIVEGVRHEDPRGFFVRLHDPDEFAAHGYPFQPVQTSLSHNIKAGTLRGLHWQSAPKAETKLVRVVRGSILDVCVDIRPESPTFCCWFGVELSAEAGQALLIGPGIAHGFITHEPDTDVLYQISPGYSAECTSGARWDDPAFGIDWGQTPVVISDRDQSFPPFHARQET